MKELLTESVLSVIYDIINYAAFDIDSYWWCNLKALYKIFSSFAFGLVLGLEQRTSYKNASKKILLTTKPIKVVISSVVNTEITFNTPVFSWFEFAYSAWWQPVLMSCSVWIWSAVSLTAVITSLFRTVSRTSENDWGGDYSLDTHTATHSTRVKTPCLTLLEVTSYVKLKFKTFRLI